MLFRFSLYGFLKNQRYFEPFLLLAMLDVGLSFTQIGLLVALRELVTATLEIPSGAIADVLGRRRSMVAAFVGYVAAYVTLALAHGLAGFALGMALVGVGDAFRTGTHKAMVFDWLRSQGREADKIEVYGYTRSWSQTGSAVSIPVAAATVYVTGSFVPVFWLSAALAVANVVNLATYPAYLEGAPQKSRSVREVARHLGRSLRAVATDPPLRRLLIEAAAFGGTYKVIKDYLQPVVAGLALSLVILRGLEAQQATAVTAGVVYVALYVLSALASRRAHRFVDRFEHPTRAAWWIWIAAGGSYALLGPMLAWGWTAAAVAGFLALALLHNLFRPLLVSRVDARSDPTAAATVLSVESQATSTAAIVLAPVMGWAVDQASASGATTWPAAAIAAAVVVATLLGVVRRDEQSAGTVAPPA